MPFPNIMSPPATIFFFFFVSDQKSYAAEQTTAPGTIGKLAASGAVRTLVSRIWTDDPSQPTADLHRPQTHRF